MTSHRNLDAQKKAPELGDSGANNLDATQILHTQTGDEQAVVRCWTKKTLFEWLGISVRSWDCAAAAGLTPAPDLVVGSSPRWSPATIAKWLQSKPRLPSRKGAIDV